MDYSDDWDWEFGLNYRNLTWLFLIVANVFIARQKGRRWLLWLLLSIPLAPLVSLFLIASRPAAASSEPAPLPGEANDACGLASPAPSCDSR